MLDGCDAADPDLLVGFGLRIDQLVILQDLFKLLNPKLYLRLFIPRVLVFGVFAQISIGDGFFQLFRNFYPLRFLKEGELFLYLCKSFLGQKDLFRAHRNGMGLKYKLLQQALLQELVLRLRQLEANGHSFELGDEADDGIFLQRIGEEAESEVIVGFIDLEPVRFLEFRQDFGIRMGEHINLDPLFLVGVRLVLGLFECLSGYHSEESGVSGFHRDDFRHELGEQCSRYLDRGVVDGSAFGRSGLGFYGLLGLGSGF